MEIFGGIRKINMESALRSSAPIERVIDIKHSQCLVQLTDSKILFRHIKHVPECYIRDYALKQLKLREIL